jgi:hypothetical protein
VSITAVDRASAQIDPKTLEGIAESVTATLNSAATRECVDGLRRTPRAGSLPGIGMIVTDIY